MQTQRNAPGKGRLKSIGFGLVLGLAGLSIGYFGGKYLKSSALLQAIGPEGAGFPGVRGTGRGARLFFNCNINLLGGLAATFPEEVTSGPELRRKFARIVAAGPFSSLLPH